MPVYDYTEGSTKMCSSYVWISAVLPKKALPIKDLLKGLEENTFLLGVIRISSSERIMSFKVKIKLYIK